MGYFDTDVTRSQMCASSVSSVICHIFIRRGFLDWLATSGGRFFFFSNNSFLITDINVLCDSIFWLNKLAVTVSIILI